MHLIRLMVVACAMYSAACAGAIVKATLAPSEPAADALLVLPGFGYSRAGERVFRSLAPAMAAEGIDLYLPTYISRGGLSASRDRLQQFIRTQRLARYRRIHVFAFIAGGWTFNPLVVADSLPNLATVVYDRSPYQERAPEIARANVPVLTWVRYGSVVFDVAKTPYQPLVARNVKIGLLIETEPTSFIKRFANIARQQGPYRFECGAFTQPYDDCSYVAMSHDELYVRFAEVWPEVRAFIRTGRFTTGANRTPPTVLVQGLDMSAAPGRRP